MKKNSQPKLQYAIYDHLGSFIDYIEVIHNDCPLAAWANCHDTTYTKLEKAGWTAKVEPKEHG